MNTEKFFEDIQSRKLEPLSEGERASLEGMITTDVFRKACVRVIEEAKAMGVGCLSINPFSDKTHMENLLRSQGRAQGLIRTLESLIEQTENSDA